MHFESTTSQPDFNQLFKHIHKIVNLYETFLNGTYQNFNVNQNNKKVTVTINFSKMRKEVLYSDESFSLIESEIWYNFNGIIDTIVDKYGALRPSVIIYYPFGEIDYMAFYSKGMLHLDPSEGPAYIKYRDDGTCDYEKNYIEGRILNKKEYYEDGKTCKRIVNREFDIDKKLTKKIRIWYDLKGNKTKELIVYYPTN